MPKLCSLDSFQPDLLTTPTSYWNHRKEWLVLEGTSRTSKIQAPAPGSAAELYIKHLVMAPSGLVWKSDLFKEINFPAR